MRKNRGRAVYRYARVPIRRYHEHQVERRYRCCVCLPRIGPAYAFASSLRPGHTGFALVGKANTLNISPRQPCFLQRTVGRDHTRFKEIIRVMLDPTDLRHALRHWDRMTGNFPNLRIEDQRCGRAAAVINTNENTAMQHSETPDIHERSRPQPNQ